MFGLSLGKLIVLVIVVLGLWYGYRWVARARKLSRERDEERSRLAGTKGAEDLVRCNVCGSFVSADARHCGREDCPYPR